MNPWCECRTTIGYSSFHDPKNIFVCVQCLKPTWLVYEKHKKLCLECAQTFSNPWEIVCPSCRDELLELAKQCDGIERVELLENVSDMFYQSWKYYRDRELATRANGYRRPPIRMAG